MANDYSGTALRKRGSEVAKSLGKKELRKMILHDACYTELFSHLRGADPDEAADFLARFYGTDDGETEPYFPNGTKLGEYMNRILHIDWFRPKRRYTAKELQPGVDAITKAFMVKGREKAVVVEDISVVRGAVWGVAWDAAWDAARGAVWGVVWSAVWGVAWDAALDAARGVAWDAAHYAAGCAARGAAQNAAHYAAGCAARGAGHIIVENIPTYREKYPVSPWEKMIDVYELGLWPAGTKGGNFLIWQPPVAEK